MSEVSSPTNEDLIIKVQETPNPMAYKFVTSVTLLDNGKRTFLATDDYSEIGLVKSLFEVSGVTQVYLFQNTISITHDGTLQSEVWVENIESVLRAKIPEHNSNIVQEESVVKRRISKSEDPEILKIEEVLDRTIRPGLQADGGDVEVIRFADNILEISYQGACGGCPSAMYGTLDAIQNILRFELKNEDLRVAPI